MSNVIELDDYRPHSNARMYCECGKRWILTFPTGATETECPQCGAVVKIGE